VPWVQLPPMTASLVRLNVSCHGICVVVAVVLVVLVEVVEVEEVEVLVVVVVEVLVLDVVLVVVDPNTSHCIQTSFAVGVLAHDDRAVKLTPASGAAAAST
jgi:hypothetical protein